MRYSIGETRDFKCKSCGMNWLHYVENNDPCVSPSMNQDGCHDFDFGKPIKVEPADNDATHRTFS
jgi:hypothetical protein